MKYRWSVWNDVSSFVRNYAIEKSNGKMITNYFSVCDYLIHSIDTVMKFKFKKYEKHYVKDFLATGP